MSDITLGSEDFLQAIENNLNTGKTLREQGIDLVKMAETAEKLNKNFIWKNTAYVLRAVEIEYSDDLSALLDRLKQDKKEWRDYLAALILQVENIWKEHQILPSSAAEKELVEYQFKEVLGLVLWLDYLNPGNKPLDPRLEIREIRAMEPRARYSKAMLDLATYIHPRFPHIREVHRTPADLWLTWELQDFHRSAIGCGVITGRPEESLSLTKEVKAQRLMLQFLENLKPSDFGTGKKVECDAGEAIVYHAAQLAATDPSFRYSKTWNGFKSTYRAWLRILRSGGFSQIAFENGKRLPAGRNAKRTPNKVNKGFVTKSLQIKR